MLMSVDADLEKRHRDNRVSFLTLLLPVLFGAPALSLAF